MLCACGSAVPVLVRPSSVLDCIIVRGKATMTGRVGRLGARRWSHCMCAQVQSMPGATMYVFDRVRVSCRSAHRRLPGAVVAGTPLCIDADEHVWLKPS
jgi:hypothetical protein